MQVNKIKNAKKSTQKVHQKRTQTSSKQKPLHRIVIKKETQKTEFPNEYPFWARFKKNKNRTTLIIDEDVKVNKAGNAVELFVHREATHTQKQGDYEKIFPNPDTDDKEPMYLKRPKKKPKKLFKPHNKKLNMPEHLKEKYSKNNKK